MTGGILNDMLASGAQALRDALMGNQAKLLQDARNKEMLPDAATLMAQSLPTMAVPPAELVGSGNDGVMASNFASVDTLESKYVAATLMSFQAQRQMKHDEVNKVLSSIDEFNGDLKLRRRRDAEKMVQELQKENEKMKKELEKKAEEALASAGHQETVYPQDTLPLTTDGAESVEVPKIAVPIPQTAPSATEKMTVDMLESQGEVVSLSGAGPVVPKVSINLFV